MCYNFLAKTEEMERQIKKIYDEVEEAAFEDSVISHPRKSYYNIGEMIIGGTVYVIFSFVNQAMTHLQYSKMITIPCCKVMYRISVLLS